MKSDDVELSSVKTQGSLYLLMSRPCKDVLILESRAYMFGSKVFLRRVSLRNSEGQECLSFTEHCEDFRSLTSFI